MLSVQGLGLHIIRGNYLFRDVNFTIKREDKIGLVGKERCWEIHSAQNAFRGTQLL